MIYARKEIAAGNTVWHILDETNNLQKVKKLCHPHLIELVKSYQIGDNNFNLIFPYAKANLHRYLRVPSLGASRTSNRTHNRLWPQMLGVAEGLKLIINRSSSSPESSIGFHFDLKPQNILILEKLQGDTLVISDFGQARLLEHDSFTSRLTFGRGTDSYTPPEHSTGFVIKAQQNKYDIWPLGIILMEVLAFVVQGETGPERLGHVRFTRERGGMDSRFWRLTDQLGKGELKPQVKRFMNDIKDNSHYVNEENKKFVSNVIDLAEDMLQPDPRCRISIDNVVERMKAIFSCERRIAPRREIPLLAGEKVLLSIEYVCCSITVRLFGTPVINWPSQEDFAYTQDAHKRNGIQSLREGASQ